MEQNSLQIEIQQMIEQELNFSCTAGSYEAWFSALVSCVNDLIVHDFNKLVFILYRLDINEARLVAMLKQYSHAGAGPIIADLIIKRQAEKIRTRKAYKKDSSTIDENERW